MTDSRKRGYRSDQRQKQRAATRARLLKSARWLFRHHGYGATSIPDIATRARVSTPTFYAVFGSKRKVLSALLEAMAADADPERLERELEEAAGDPIRQLTARVAFTTRLYRLGADVLETVRMAGGTDRDLVALWRRGEKRRRKREAPLITEWMASGVLRKGLDRKAAADLFWALTGPDVYQLLVMHCRWPTDRFEAWLVETLGRELFGIAGAP
jgi:AcrR family transcriptional regulator